MLQNCTGIELSERDLKELNLLVDFVCNGLKNCSPGSFDWYFGFKCLYECLSFEVKDLMSSESVLFDNGKLRLEVAKVMTKAQQ